MLYECEKGHLFGEPDVRRDEIGGYEIGVGYMPTYSNVEVCPYCRTESFHNLKPTQCDLCEIEYDEDELYEFGTLYVCLECIEKLKLFLEEFEDV